MKKGMKVTRWQGEADAGGITSVAPPSPACSDPNALALPPLHSRSLVIDQKWKLQQIEREHSRLYALQVHRRVGWRGSVRSSTAWGPHCFVCGSFCCITRALSVLLLPGVSCALMR